jgi:mannose-6-phosphate isomerase-like protein (cupin superfamily)
MPSLPRLIESLVVQNDSYESDQGEFAHKRAATAAHRSTTPPPVSALRKSRTGVARFRAQAVRPVNEVGVEADESDPLPERSSFAPVLTLGPAYARASWLLRNPRRIPVRVERPDDVLVGPDLHHHDSQVDSFYVLEGELQMTVEDSEHPAGPGTLAPIPRGVRDTFRHLDGRSRVLNMHAPDGGFGDFLRRISNRG